MGGIALIPKLRFITYGCHSFVPHLRQKVSLTPSFVPQRIQNVPAGVCPEAADSCELDVVGLLSELRLVIMNSVARNNARKMAARALKPVSIVVSTVVVVNVVVSMRGSCVEMAVQVVTLISVMTE